MSDAPSRIEELFHAALNRGPSECSDFLRQACGRDEGLRAKLESLLAADEQAGGFLDSPIGEAVATQSVDAAAPLAPGLPQRIGPYAIKRVIASGGMGTVYEAVQEHPRRAVALKVMRQGIASRSALRRFEYESQVLARLRHPGIAQVFDAGTHREEPEGPGDGGVPYFVMEYIPNARPITEYARLKQLGTRQRLEMFSRVCEAVHHGHQKGIIHRDLKPANILVDARGDPKVIDFGVARATDSDLAVTTLQTDVGQLIGTIQYMSPEQCEADPHDLDSRSDVYSLGVVLYELLAERLPYDVTRVTMFEATRLIREQPPTRLSTVSRALRGDVETIVLKALEKDRTRRYQSADELRRDIDHYLKGEPILARPPSVVYQLRLLARKNKALVGSAAAVLLVLLVSVAVSWGLYLRAEWARAGEQEQRRLAEANEQTAAREAAKARAVNEFLRQMLASADPEQALGREVSVREVLDEAARKMEAGSMSGQPEVEAAVRQTVGSTYRSLGLVEPAETHLRAAADYCRGHPDRDPELWATSLSELGMTLLEQGDLPAAESLLREVLELETRRYGDDHEHVANATQNLAILLKIKGRYDEAEGLYRKTLALRRRLLGGDHEHVASTLTSLAELLRITGHYNEAESLHREALAIYRGLSGDHRPQVSICLNNLGQVLHAKGHHAAAEPVLREALELVRAVYGDEHPRTAVRLNNLATLLVSMGRFEEAEPLHREALAVRRECLGDDHPDVGTSLNNLAVLLERRGDPRAAEPLYREALDVARGAFGDRHLRVGWTLASLGRLRGKRGDHAGAEPLLRESSSILEEALPAGHWQRADAQGRLGECLANLGRFDEAAALLLGAYKSLEHAPDVPRKRKREALERLVRLYEAWGKPQEAEPYRALLEAPETASRPAEP